MKCLPCFRGLPVVKLRLAALPSHAALLPCSTSCCPLLSAVRVLHCPHACHLSLSLSASPSPCPASLPALPRLADHGRVWLDGVGPGLLHRRLGAVPGDVQQGKHLRPAMRLERFSEAAVCQPWPGPACTPHHQQLPCLTPALRTAPTLPQEVLPLFPLDWEKIRGRRRYGATGTRKDLAPKVRWLQVSSKVYLFSTHTASSWPRVDLLCACGAGEEFFGESGASCCSWLSIHQTAGQAASRPPYLCRVPPTHSESVCALCVPPSQVEDEQV